MGANERPAIALVGGPNRGRQTAIPAVKAGADLKILYDLAEEILRKVGGKIAAAQGRAPQFVKEYERALPAIELKIERSHNRSRGNGSSQEHRCRSKMRRGW